MFHFMCKVYIEIIYYITIYNNKNMANEFNLEKKTFKFIIGLFKKQNMSFWKEEIYHKFTLEVFF